MLEPRLAQGLAHSLLDVAAAQLAIGADEVGLRLGHRAEDGRPIFMAVWWNCFLQPQVPEWPEQRSTVVTAVSGIISSASRVFWPTFCTREWHGTWYETFPSGVLKSVFRSPSLRRETKYSKGSNIASCTAFTSASSGNMSGNSCLNMSVQEGIGVTIA